MQQQSPSQRRRRLLLAALYSIFALLTACASVAQAPPGEDLTYVPAPLPPQTIDTPPLMDGPVPPAATLLEQGLAQRRLRNYRDAAISFRLLLDHYPSAPEYRAAAYYLAQTSAQRGDWTAATIILESLRSDSTTDEFSAPALFWLARGYQELNNTEQAIATYADYRALGTLLAPYAALRQAQIYSQHGEHARAADAYEACAESSISPAQRAACYEHAIAARRTLGDDAQALAHYHALLDFARLPAYRTRILSEAAALAQTLGQTQQAQDWSHEILSTTPDNELAVTAVKSLRATNDARLSDAQAAQILVRHAQHETALPILNEVITQTLALPQAERTLSTEELLELQRMQAMSLRETGHFTQALTALQTISEQSPNSEPGRQARLDAIQTLGQSGKTREAAQAYRDYADTYPNDPRAPEALFRAALLYERLDEPQMVTRIRLDLGRRYPESTQAHTALETSATNLMQQGNDTDALAAWQQLTNYADGTLRARAAFWSGRLMRELHMGSADDARPWFEMAYHAAPYSYYGVRAAEEAGILPTGTIPIGTPFIDDDWLQIAAWIATWSNDAAPTHTDAINEVAQRAHALREVGLVREADGEWAAARTALAENPQQLLLLARAAYEGHQPTPALHIATQLSTLAPPNAAPTPIPLLRLMFPTPWSDVVLAETAAQNLDPRLLYALMRQESLFQPDAVSHVGARGLTQIMPTTGEWIAQKLQMQGFELDDLGRIDIAARFSAYYLGQIIHDMNNSIQGGLAGYNAGPGHAQRWAGGYHVADPDRFAERIDYAETRGYVQHVYGFYGAYRQIYAPPE